MNGWFCCTATAETTEEFCPKIQTRISETFPEGAAPWKENGSPRRIVNELLLSGGHWTGGGVAIAGEDVVMGRDDVVKTVVFPVVLTGADDHDVHPIASRTKNRTMTITTDSLNGNDGIPDIVFFPDACFL
jgi:hypothetical protein